MSVLGAEPLKAQYDCRVFRVNNKVCKYFDKKEHLYEINFKLLVEMGHLNNVKVSNVTDDGQIVLLMHDYIEGTHKPKSLKQFIGVLET